LPTLGWFSNRPYNPSAVRVGVGSHRDRFATATTDGES
jgi:hypothetical protein